MQVTVILLAMIAVIVPLWMGRRYGLLPLLSPLHLTGYFAALGFALKVVAQGQAPSLAFYAGFVSRPDALLAGALYLACFVGMLCLGYRLAVAPQDGRLDRFVARDVAGSLRHHGTQFWLSVAASVLTVAIIHAQRGGGLGLAALLAQVNADKQIAVGANGVGATLAGIKTLFVVPKCAFVLLLAYGLARDDGRAKGQAALLGAVLVMVAALSGDRFELVELCLYAAIIWAVVDGGLRRGVVVAGLTGLAVAVLLAAQMTYLRGQASFWQQIAGSTYFLDINAAVIAVARAEADLRLWGESYLWWSWGWVPRAWWADKPAVDLGVYFKTVIAGQKSGGAFNVTGPGEAFINFGWWGLLCAPVIGALFRRIEVTLLGAKGLRHGGAVIYALLFYPFVQAMLQSSFSAFVVGAVAQGVLIWAMLRIFVPRRRPAVAGGLAYAV